MKWHKPPKVRYLILASALIVLIGVELIFLLNRTPKLTFAQKSASAEAQVILSSCKGKLNMPGFETCYATELGDLTKKTTLEFAVQTLSELEKIDSNANECHLIAHEIALAETSKDPNSWKEMLRRTDPQQCGGGYLHGIIESRYKLDPSFVLNDKTMTEICSLVKDTQGPAGDFNCTHIMGHLLLVEDSPDFKEAVKGCYNFPDDPKILRNECFAGVFMENEFRDNLAVHGLAKHIDWNKQTTDDQKKLCLSFSGREAMGCWRELAHMVVVISNEDPAQVYQYCAQAPTQTDVFACYEHAMTLMLSSSKFNSDYLGQLCKYYQPDQDFPYCADVAVFHLMDITPNLAPRIIQFCQVTPDANKSSCFKNIGRQLKVMFTPAERNQLCSGVSENYQSACSSV